MGVDIHFVKLVKDTLSFREDILALFLARAFRRHSLPRSPPKATASFSLCAVSRYPRQTASRPPPPTSPTVSTPPRVPLAQSEFLPAQKTLFNMAPKGKEQPKANKVAVDKVRSLRCICCSTCILITASRLA